MAQSIIGYLARCDWDDVELSAVFEVMDCAGVQSAGGIAVEWIAETSMLRVKSKWNPESACAEVQLGGVVIDLAPECALKFCKTEAAAEEWLLTQMD